MKDKPCVFCPGYNDRNRFDEIDYFIGEIENGKRYPLGVYTKEQVDEKLAAINTEIDTKANEAQTTEAITQINAAIVTKADKEETTEAIEDINRRLSELEYKDISITNFKATPSTCEKGSTQEITLTWTINKTATTQEINGASVTGTAKKYTGVTNSVNYVLSVSDGHTSAIKTAAVVFANNIYYGASETTESMQELTNVLSENKARTITVNAAAGQYIIYALPARLGNVTFEVGGFEGGFSDPEERTLSNDSGYAEKYYIYKSVNAGLGVTTVNIK